MIKTVVFDFGGVLVDWNPRHLYDKYFGDSEKSLWFLDNVCTYDWNIQMDGGKPFAEGVAEMVEKFPEYKEAIEIYHSRWVEMIGGEVEGTADLIRRLKAAGYGVYGLTNWSNETYPFIRDTYPIFSEFDGIVVSGDEKLLKPDPAIYDCLLGRYGLKAEESIFIDDNVANVAGAMVVGMYAIQFQDAKQVEDQLRLQFELEF